MTTSGLTPYQTAYQATLVQQAASLAGGITPQGTPQPTRVFSGETPSQELQASLQAQTTATLVSALPSGTGAPSPSPETPLTAPGTSPYQAGLSATELSGIATLFGSLGLGLNANVTA